MAERRQDTTFSQTRCGAASGGPAEAADFPFPVKPVCLRNGLNTGAQDAINNSCNFSVQKISKQEASRGLAKEIHMREQILQEKLYRLGEKIRQRILRETGDSAEEDRKMPQPEQQSGERTDGREKTMLESQPEEGRRLGKTRTGGVRKKQHVHEEESQVGK